MRFWFVLSKIIFDQKLSFIFDQRLSSYCCDEFDFLAFGEKKSQIILDIFIEDFKAKILKVCETFTPAN